MTPNKETYNFNKIFLSIQVAVIGSFFTNFMGLEFLYVTEVIYFIYLTFVPGFLMINIMKINNINNGIKFLYSIGLSISFIMLNGLILNSVLPLYFVFKPISFIPLFLSINISCIIMFFYLFLKKIPLTLDINKNFLDLRLGFFYLLPIWTVIGTIYLNTFNLNINLLSLIIIISFAPLLVFIDKIKNENIPIMVFVLSLSLLYHRSLISNYLWGWDIHLEYYYAKEVIKNGVWTFNIHSNINSLLSINMLAPVYSEFCGINLVWVFKIIYPLLFTIVPISIFYFLKEQIHEKKSFYAVFFLISTFTFYGELPVLGRQQIAEIFLILIVMLIFIKSNSFENKVIKIILTFSLIVSHYGIAFIFLFSLLLSFIVFELDHFLGINKFYKKRPKIVNGRYILSTVFLTIIWYMYISKGSIFKTIVIINKRAISSLFMEKASGSAGVTTVQAETISPIFTILKGLHLFSVLMILIAIISIVFLNFYYNKFDNEYLLFAFVYSFIAAGFLLIPHIASSLTLTRLYHISLLFLSIFVIVGIYFAFNNLKKINKHISWKDKHEITIVVFLMIFILFNTGFINQITGMNEYSISFNRDIDYPRYNDAEIESARFASSIKSEETYIYSDNMAKWLISGYIGERWKINIFYNNTNNSSMESNSLIYFRTLNTDNTILKRAQKLTFSNRYDYGNMNETIFYDNVIKNSNKIYDNDRSSLYYYS